MNSSKYLAVQLLLLLLLAGASATYAQAPAGGSVTLFGVMDIYAGKLQYAGRNSVNVVNPGALTTSRWGMMGSEDLGNGLRATFNLASLFRPDTGEAVRHRF